jgi:DNA-binding SARP family transcriptional activator
MRVEMRLLGCFSVRCDENEVPPGAFGGRLTRALIRILVTRRGRFVSNDVLAEALWPERTPADPDGNLTVLVNRARRALGDPSLITTGPRGYSFASGDACLVDAEAFLGRVAAIRGRRATRDAAGVLEEARAALEGWGGEPLPEDAYEDWAQEYRVTLMRAYVEVLEAGAEAALALARPAEAVGLAELIVAREPLREAGHLLRVRALAASGDTAAALDAFEQFRGRLAEELGLDPSPEAAEVQARVLRGQVEQRGIPAGPSPVLTPSGQPFEDLRFVGRDVELERILSALGGPAPATVVVAGPAGAGKSRLLGEIGTRSGLPVLRAKAFLPERDEPWGLARTLLREALAHDPDAAAAIPDRAAQALADVVPEIEELRPGGASPIDAQSRRALALEAGVRLIGAAASRGVLVVADDLQWADATSVALLGLLIRRVPGAGVILAYRPEEVGPALASLLAHLPRMTDGALTIRLRPLDAEAIGELLPDGELARAIVEETDRTPLAVAEVVRELAASGVIERHEGGRWRARSERAVERARESGRMGQRRAIRARADQQPAGRKRLLSMLSLLGREAPARLLARATGEDQVEVLADLEALARADLARLGDQGWATAHDLITESIAESLDRPERGRLHEMLARALHGEGVDPSELARHLAAAGDPRAAAGAFAAAARQSLDRHASEEAERLADAGMALQPSAEVRAELLDVRAEARFRRGDLAGARQDLRGALAGKPAGPGHSRLLTRMALLASGSEDLARAAELVELAVTEAAGDREARAEALSIGAIVDMNAGRQERAHERFDEALALFEQTGDARKIAHVLDCQAMHTWLEGNLPKAAADFDRVAGLFLETGELMRLGTPRASRGQVLVLMGRAQEGLAEIEDALELEQSLGHTEGQAYALWYRSEALTALGRTTEAMESAGAALAIAESLGHRELTAATFKGLGFAKRTAGDLEGAEAALRRSLDTAAGHLPLFVTYAASELALVLVAQGALDEAESVVRAALDCAVPAGLYEARLAHAEVAAARGEPDAPAIAAWALAAAEAGKHELSAGRLRELARAPAPSPPGHTTGTARTA